MTSGGPRLISWIDSLSERLNRITECFLVMIGMTMALVTGFQVFSRYVLNHSLFWSEEVGRICLVWISFLGASAAYKRRAHIGMDFMVVRLPHKTRRTIEMLGVFLSLLLPKAKPQPAEDGGAASKGPAEAAAAPI